MGKLIERIQRLVVGHATFTEAPPASPAANTLYKASIPRAWVNFDGSGTLSIRDSFNVASVNDDGTGQYTVNWDTNLADGNYAAVGIEGTGSWGLLKLGRGGQISAGSLDVQFADTDGFSFQDCGRVMIAVFGDQ